MQCLNPSAREVELLDLSSVMPLMQFLCSLPQDHENRELSSWEDGRACEVLRAIRIPDYVEHAQDYVAACLDPVHSDYRTLAVWYQIARRLAWLIQNAD